MSGICKTDEEIALIRASNILVSKTLGVLSKYIKAGQSTRQLDTIAEEYIRDHGAEPAFKGYRGYPATLCTSVNDVVVHGIPSEYVLEEGDIVSVDVGVLSRGYYGDSAYTFAVGQIKPEIMRLLEATQKALFLGIENAVAGKRIGDIGFAIQNYIENNGYSIVREMVGHGIGTHLHEKPEVPNYGRRGAGMVLKKGMVLCIEPMVNMGKRNIIQDKDGWTIRTQDSLPSAHFELAVMVDEKKANILSTFDYIN